MQFETLAKLYQHFDDLADQDASSDILFASSYIRGFIGLSASEFGDEQQRLSLPLAENVSRKLHEARTELSPQDRIIVKGYWQSILIAFK